jgi:heme exporter protein D
MRMSEFVWFAFGVELTVVIGLILRDARERRHRCGRVVEERSVTIVRRRIV